MRYFNVVYYFRKGLNGPEELRTELVAFDDIDPETTEQELKKMAAASVENRFLHSVDFPAYGKFWRIDHVYEVDY